MKYKNYYVYVHKQEDGTVFYVGQGTLYRYKSIHNRTKDWWEIYNKSKCSVQIIQDNLTREESLILEAVLIKKYGRKDKNNGTLVNKNDGGTACKEEDNYFYGKQLIGESNGNYGNKYKKNPLSKPVYMLDLEGNIIKEFASSKEAEDIGNFIATSVSSCCIGKRKMHNGYQFIFKKDYTLPINHIYTPAKTEKKKVVAIGIENGNMYIHKIYDKIGKVVNDGFSKSSVEKRLNQFDKLHRGFIFAHYDKIPKELLNTNKI